MRITETKIKVSDLCKNYSDDGDDGVLENFAYAQIFSVVSYIQISREMQ